VVEWRVGGLSALSPHAARWDLDHRQQVAHRVRQRRRVVVRPSLQQRRAQLGRREWPVLQQLAPGLDDRLEVQPFHPLAVGIVLEQVTIQRRLHEWAQGHRIGRADEVDGRAHQRDPDGGPPGEQLGYVRRPAPGDAAPQAHVPGVRGLRLQPDEMLGRLQRAELGAPQQHLPFEGGPTECAPAQRPHRLNLPK
jgi:hypothetical protein